MRSHRILRGNMVLTAWSSSVNGGGGGEAFRFAERVVRGQWFTVFASFLIMAVASGTYMFGLYSHEIKASLGYDQTSLNWVGFFKDVGGNFGILAGLIAEVTPTWVVLLIGSAMNFVGYFMIWLAVAGKISKPGLWYMCFCICIGANSQSFTNTASIVSCAKNFPENRSIMLGLLKGFAGLSGAIMTQIYLAIYGEDPKSLILFIGWLPAAVSAAFMYTVRTMKVDKQPNELRVLYQLLYVSITLALFLMAVTIVQKQAAFTRGGYWVSAAVVFILLMCPLFIAIREELVLWKTGKQRVVVPHVEVNIGKQLLEKSDPEKNPKTSSFLNVFEKPERGEDYTILQAILSIDMLLLSLVTLLGLGSSLTAIDNLGQIGESLGYPSRTISCFVSLVSIWNCFGRIFSGFASESLQAKWKFPRPMMITLVLLLLCVGHLLIAFPVPGSVYVASVIIGFSFGAQFPLNLTIISEIFGLKHYSTLCNFGSLASPIGSYLLNVKLTGTLYDREALKQLADKGLDRSSVQELTCIGVQCFRFSFIVLAAITLLGALISLVFVVRTREFYRGSRFQKRDK